MRPTTIFRQLIINVVIPSVIALIVLAVLNYINTKQILNNAIIEKNKIISDQIKHILELQDVALANIESRYDAEMEYYSNQLVNYYFDNTDNIEHVDLNKIRMDIGMDSTSEDIYIINKEGIIINTTFEKDKNINVFTFGADYKAFILGIFNDSKFIAEKFTIEGVTRKIKKYTYIPTLDKQYIIELGAYSKNANEIMEKIKSTLNEISSGESNVMSVDLFLSEENPFSLNTSSTVSDEQLDFLKKVFRDQNRQTYYESAEKGYYHNEYIYMEREGTDLYKSSVIRIITDKSNEQSIYTRELLKFLIIFGATIIVVLIMTYKKTVVITNPLKNLVNNNQRLKMSSFIMVFVQMLSACLIRKVSTPKPERKLRRKSKNKA